jgi:hypothetical protein
MKCEKCGSEISINDKYCPSCGALNDIGASHIDDMKRFEKRFSNTENVVRNKSDWFVKYITPMVVLLVSAVIFVVLATFMADSGYSISRKRIEAYNSSHAAEIDEHITELMNDEKYLETYMLYYVADQVKSDGTSEYYNGWYRYLNVVDYYYQARDSVIAHYISGDADYGDSNLSKAASAIYEFYAAQSEKSLTRATPDSIIYIQKIKTDMESFLKAYCKFTDEDISSLPEKDKTGIVTLMARRMTDEE